jgi:hypothetical protein
MSPTAAEPVASADVEQVLAALAVVMVLMVVAWVGSLLAVVLAVRRANRVDRRVATPAPLTWLFSPRAGARLHRRLRAAVRLAQHSTPVHAHGSIRARRTPARPGRAHPLRGRAARGRSPHEELVDELAGRAVALDRQVVAAAAGPAASRRGRLAAVAADTALLEAAASNLAEVAAAASMPPGGDRDLTRDLVERIDHLAAAHAELRRLEAVPSR